jgi:CIC family chloride channel protein
MDRDEAPSLDETQRLRASSELRAADPELKLGRRLFPRGVRGLVPDERTRFLGVCALVGALAAVAAIAFRLALQGVTIAFFGSYEDLVVAATFLPSWRRVVLPAAGAVAAVALARVLATRGGGGGVAGIMEAVSLKRGVISLRGAVERALGSLFSIGSGGSIGREGPIIQLASAVGSRVGRAMGLTDERTRVLCACGAAAGFAAAYNTPMAATLFVVEVIAGTTTFELIGPAAVSAVVATAVTQLTLGDGPLYGAKGFALASPLEFLPYVVLALMSGVVSTLFLGVLDAAEWVFSRALRSRILRGLAGGLAVGAIGAFLPEVYGNGFETTLRLLDATLPLRLVLVLLAAKLVATALTVGSGGAGGVFTPTLMVGAALGAAVGIGAGYLLPGHVAPPGAYALVGMAALLAATTHAPLMATVFVFEVTRDYAIVLPLLLTCHVAASFARALRPASIYEEDARRRGVALDRSTEQRALKGMRAIDLYRPVPSIPPGLALDALLEAFASSRATTLFVARDDGRFFGVIDIADAREALHDPSRAAAGRTASALARPVPAVGPAATGVRVLEVLHESEREEVPVVDQDGVLLGVISRRQIESAVDREVIRRGLRVFESISDRLSAVQGALSLPPETRLEQVRVPRLLDGRRIAEAGLREKYGLTVLGIVRRGSDGHVERRAVDALTTLSFGEELVVIGSPDALARFRALR